MHLDEVLNLFDPDSPVGPSICGGVRDYHFSDGNNFRLHVAVERLTVGKVELCTIRVADRLLNELCVEGDGPAVTLPNDPF